MDLEILLKFFQYAINRNILSPLDGEVGCLAAFAIDAVKRTRFMGYEVYSQRESKSPGGHRTKKIFIHISILCVTEKVFWSQLLMRCTGNVSVWLT